MKAIRVQRYGTPDVFGLKEIELPDPKAGEVLVRLQAVGLNFVDVYQRRGEYPASLPFTPGFEGAGIVEAVGENPNGFKTGDRVAYTSHPGAYAEASVVPASKLIPLPNDLSFEQGAAFPLQGTTAHYLIPCTQGG